MAQTITVKLSITPGGIAPVIHLSQYDKMARTLAFSLADVTGTYTAPPGVSATIRGTKPDHTGFEYACMISGTTVTVAVHDQMTVCAGRVPCELRITGSDGSILGTANFCLLIEAAAFANDVSISKTDLPLIEKAAENIDTATAAAKTATANAADASSSATSAAKSSSAAAASASSAKTSETNAAASAVAAKQSETNAASSASSAKTSETNAAASTTAASTSANQAAASAKAAADSATTAASIAGVGEFAYYISKNGLHFKFKKGGINN